MAAFHSSRLLAIDEFEVLLREYETAFVDSVNYPRRRPCLRKKLRHFAAEFIFRNIWEDALVGINRAANGLDSGAMRRERHDRCVV
jgi:hypothetical protein